MRQTLKNRSRTGIILLQGLLLAVAPSQKYIYIFFQELKSIMRRNICQLLRYKIKICHKIYNLIRKNVLYPITSCQNFHLKIIKIISIIFTACNVFNKLKIIKNSFVWRRKIIITTKLVRVELFSWHYWHCKLETSMSVERRKCPRETVRKNFRQATAICKNQNLSFFILMSVGFRLHVWIFLCITIRLWLRFLNLLLEYIFGWNYG